MVVNSSTTVRVSKIPLTVIAKDLLGFFESITGKDSVFACEIHTEHKNWKSKGDGRVQFETIDAVNKVNLLSIEGKLIFHGNNLAISPSLGEIILRPTEAYNRFGQGLLHVGFLVERDKLKPLETLEVIKAEIIPQRNQIVFWVVEGLNTYKLEIQFDDVFSAWGCSLNGGKSNAFLLKLKYAPKIYRKTTGTALPSQSSPNRYSISKEKFEFLWVRTTDFSLRKSFGVSSTFCWELKAGSFASDTLTGLPYYEGALENFTLEQVEQTCFGYESGPLIRCPSASKLSYEILFQLNSLVHAQKLSLPAAVNTGLIELLSSLSVDSASMLLQKLQSVKSTCYEAVSIVQSEVHSPRRTQKDQMSLSQSSLAEKNLMSCHRVLITPLKLYCLGPDIETSNYVVKHFSAFASDFLRVTFVEEDWSKLPSDALTITIGEGFYSKSCRTAIYRRVLGVLRDGIEIGDKRFEFLAFSASQLRSSSVWMFASNDKVKAEDIREWMGCFKSIRSVSKCAARMGQLFSSSFQTFDVSIRDVGTIPDVEVTTDGIKYCFSDGIGKISHTLADQIAQKRGLSEVPSAFQIRFGGYKGVLAVDRSCFKKLLLRPSMLKFESQNRMLSVTSWSQSMPCFLNREIVSLLSTLGIEDEKFEAMQHEQICLLDEMLTKIEAALVVLEGVDGGEIKNILLEMLRHGYKPNLEPYLLMMLRAHREYQLADIRSKCRISVSKGRLLMGCLDETATLNYGQVYVRVTMTKAELQCGDQIFFEKVDETTSVIVGKVVVTRNPCLHPGDIRVLEAVNDPELVNTGMLDCLVFPQKGERPHPNECSGGDLDGDLFFVCWDENLIPLQTATPMDYIARRQRIMDHEVTLEEIQKFFVDYMINDSLGIIATAHLVHADREPDKARSGKCLQLATLHSMAVDFAKTGAPAEMPRVLKPKEYPDFLEREEKPMYPSTGVLGKLYRAIVAHANYQDPEIARSDILIQTAYDHDLEVDEFEAYLETAESHKQMYLEKFVGLMNYYGAESEVEILTGHVKKVPMYLKRDKKRYKEMKDRVLDSIALLLLEAKEWFRSSCCKDEEQTKLASAWYHVTYHPKYIQDGTTSFLSFPWIVGDVLLRIKSIKSSSSSSRSTDMNRTE